MTITRCMIHPADIDALLPPDHAGEVIAVWPCDHGGVQVEPGPAKPGYHCSTCGAVASTYVLASSEEEARDGD